MPVTATVWVVVNKRTGQYLGASSGWWGWYDHDSGSVRRYESEDEAQSVRDLLPMRMQKHAAEKPRALYIERFAASHD